MQKKSKTILTAVVTALFVLSLGYFALLAPTTAWYYQREEKSYSFSFTGFNMNVAKPENVASDATLVFPAATRFADGGEVLFDKMIHVIHVNAANNGFIDGNVTVNVKKGNTVLHEDDDNTNGTQGLKWFIYEPAPKAETFDDFETGSNAEGKLQIQNQYDGTLKFILELKAPATETAGSGYSIAINNTTQGTVTNGSLPRNSESYTTYDISGVASGDKLEVSGSFPADTEFRLTVCSNDSNEELPSDIGLYDVAGECKMSGDYKTLTGKVPAGGRQVVVEPSSVKAAIGTMLKKSDSSWPLDYKTNSAAISGLSSGSSLSYDDKYEMYNKGYDSMDANQQVHHHTGALEVLKAHNENGITVEGKASENDPAVTKQIYVAFWAEYGDLKEIFGAEDVTRTTTTQYYRAPIEDTNPVEYQGLTIEVVARPNAGGTKTAALTVSASGVSNDVNVRLSVWTNNNWAAYSGSYTQQTNLGAANASASQGSIGVQHGFSSSVNLPVGTRFKLEIQGTNPSTRFADSSASVDETGTVYTGTVSNTGNSIAIVNKSSISGNLVISNKTGNWAKVKVEMWKLNQEQQWEPKTFADVDSPSIITEYTIDNVSMPISKSNNNSDVLDTILITAGKSAHVSLPKGIKFKLEITETGDGSVPAVFNNSGNATIIYGTVDEVNEVTIIPKPPAPTP